MWLPIGQLEPLTSEPPFPLVVSCVSYAMFVCPLDLIIITISAPQLLVVVNLPTPLLGTPDLDLKLLERGCQWRGRTTCGVLGDVTNASGKFPNPCEHLTQPRLPISANNSWQLPHSIFPQLLRYHTQRLEYLSQLIVYNFSTEFSWSISVLFFLARDLLHTYWTNDFRSTWITMGEGAHIAVSYRTGRHAFHESDFFAYPSEGSLCRGGLWQHSHSRVQREGCTCALDRSLQGAIFPASAVHEF